jgi:hypothetical protein
MTTTLLTPPPTHENEALAAQRMACEALVQSCERSLYELRCALGRAERPSDVRCGLTAADLLAEVLEGWRETLASLRTADAAATFTHRSSLLTPR